VNRLPDKSAWQAKKKKTRGGGRSKKEKRLNGSVRGADGATRAGNHKKRPS